MSLVNVDNLSKKYNLAKEKKDDLTLREFFYFFFQKLPIFFSKKRKNEEFWALKNVSFSIEKGETVGIIGPNGAGKSTLLKIISRITFPTEGLVHIEGRLASLLEVGTGFHPELTGKENIFMSGSILGMSREDIEKKYDEIVKFSGIEKFINMPVKFYSSGMYVRLGFSVAIHVDPDILIIDEVFAIGDIRFQEKCLKKINELSTTGEKAIILVTHNIATIAQVCDKCIYLKDGKLKMIGGVNKVISEYRGKKNKSSCCNLEQTQDRTGEGGVIFTKIEVLNHEDSTLIFSRDSLKVYLDYKNISKMQGDYSIVIGVWSGLNEMVLLFDSKFSNNDLSDLNESGSVICKTGKLDLIEGEYSVNIAILVDDKLQDRIVDACSIKVKTKAEDYNLLSLPNYKSCSNLVTYEFIRNVKGN